MFTQFQKMEEQNKKEASTRRPTKKQKRRLPPKRGQVMINILKGFFFRSARACHDLSSSSTTPAATPSLYNSDAES
ncbi:hypothetical protein ACOSP7_016538 [Xanthoceras sorbifolium]